MVLALTDLSKFAIAVAVGMLQCILKPLLDFLEGPATACCPVTRMAIVSMIVTIVVAYFVGVFPLYIHLARGAAAPLSPASLRHFTCVFFSIVFDLRGVLPYATDGR